MSESVDWEAEKFKEVFEDELRVLNRRIQHNRNCTLQDIQGTLDSLYILEGNNLSGRSKVHEISLSASIAAYEQFIEDWKNNKLGGNYEKKH